MYISFHFQAFVSVPQLLLPMDFVINGGVLLGSIDGVLHGGASVIPGQFGSALKLNGNNQYVDYGLHLDKCYHNPDKCSDGMTFALWLNAHAYNIVIMDTGGMDTYSVGYWLLITSGRSIKISIKNESMYNQYEAPDFPLNEWIHIVFTWTPSNTGLIHLYINSCGVDATNEKGHAVNLARFRPINNIHKFSIGSGFDGSRLFANADIDELIFWNQDLGPFEVWQLYVFGGGMWMYRKVSNIRRTKSQNWNASRLIL